MNIVWHYLDKRQAAINALKDFNNMAYIIEDTGEDIADIHEKLETPRNSDVSGMPKVNNTKSSEERLVAGIDEIDVLKERYRQALEYMIWFKPAWNELSDDEKYILNMFFLTQYAKTEIVSDIGEKLCIERSQVYHRKDRAVEKLSLLLYGK